MRILVAIIIAGLAMTGCGVAVVDAECSYTGDLTKAGFVCSGDDLLWCRCIDYGPDSSCPSGEGTWVKQGILCTCQEWMDDRCPVE